VSRRRDPLSDVQAATRGVLIAAATGEPPLRPRTWRVLSAVLAVTATWTKLEDEAPHGQLGNLCGLDKPSDRRNLSRELRHLAERGLIVYRPGSSVAGRQRTLSVVGLPPVSPDRESLSTTPGQDRPPVQKDDPRSETHTTPGRNGHGPPVGPDHPSLHSPYKTPPDPKAVGFVSDFLEQLPNHASRQAIEADRCHMEKLRKALQAAERRGISAGKAAKAVGQGNDVTQANHPAAMAAEAVTGTR